MTEPMTQADKHDRVLIDMTRIGDEIKEELAKLDERQRHTKVDQNHVNHYLTMSLLLRMHTQMLSHYYDFSQIAKNSNVSVAPAPDKNPTTQQTGIKAVIASLVSFIKGVFSFPLLSVGHTILICIAVAFILGMIVTHTSLNWSDLTGLIKLH